MLIGACNPMLCPLHATTRLPTPDGLIPVTVSASAMAVLVTLTTLASGVFSDNAFLLTPDTPTKLLFTPYGPIDAVALKASLRIVHLAQYM